MSSKAPRSERLKIGIIGRRNVGKSSLINSLINQDVAIVSSTPGTTTDPVAKHYELLPIGPVTFYDTAGIDDEGEVGEKRIKSTEKIIFRSDIALVITDEKGLKKYEKDIINKMDEMNIPFIVIFNKNDLNPPSKDDIDFCKNNHLQFISISAKENKNIDSLKEKIISIVPKYFKKENVIIGDLIRGGDFVVLVVPIDLAAPKGRLILPQVQVIREILDNDAIAITVKEKEIAEVFNKIDKKPKLVITDSQVVLRVSPDVPKDINFTTFSTAFARYKGDLEKLVQGAKEIDHLETNDKVLIAEACSHHIQSDDIGRVKIPRWLMQYTGKKLDIDVASGHDFPEDLEKYKLVIHCGACMLTGIEMKRRINQCYRRKVPITNYGVTISKVHGLLERVIKPFGL
ncbi:MAG: [FeFe] hydrogenase H-cluster maturation GTPase HydF [Candidatus Mcinerneyibacterium aminivorans]|uniref:[FeFe] hydrogenase H-cluster maturation GTPase HydF n=1 Tax=Candidatus Mcinerneyibacterium aminivorans TaxID=2703815 RepID=A0A5D0MGI9_9BACT|nr:MAG: [FeFe] hydrogenase H-cluster maturation GTPase HydF [Candidatus Mcinerneyibacterium aminivorans]